MDSRYISWILGLYRGFSVNLVDSRYISWILGISRGFPLDLVDHVMTWYCWCLQRTRATGTRAGTEAPAAAPNWTSSAIVKSNSVEKPVTDVSGLERVMPHFKPRPILFFALASKATLPYWWSFEYRSYGSFAYLDILSVIIFLLPTNTMQLYLSFYANFYTIRE